MKKNRTQENENLDEINPYQVDKFSRIPNGLIITFLKFWAAAAAVFFILIGGRDLGLDFSKPLADGYAEMTRTIIAIILVSLFLAILLNYGVKHLAHLMHSRRNNAKRWMIFNQKGFLTFLVYLVYSFMCMILTFLVVAFLGSHKLIPSFLENAGSGIEPFSFGLIFIVIDGLFLLVKNYTFKLIKVLRYRKRIQEA